VATPSYDTAAPTPQNAQGETSKRTVRRGGEMLVDQREALVPERPRRPRAGDREVGEQLRARGQQLPLPRGRGGHGAHAAACMDVRGYRGDDALQAGAHEQCGGGGACRAAVAEEAEVGQQLGARRGVGTGFVPACVCQVWG